MNIIIVTILSFLGIVYFMASEGAMFIYVVPDQDGEYDSKLESKRLMKAMLLIPVVPIIGPYFIYKVLNGGDK